MKILWQMKLRQGWEVSHYGMYRLTITTPKKWMGWRYPEYVMPELREKMP